MGSREMPPCHTDPFPPLIPEADGSPMIIRAQELSLTPHQLPPSGERPVHLSWEKKSRAVLEDVGLGEGYEIGRTGPALFLLLQGVKETGQYWRAHPGNEDSRELDSLTTIQLHRRRPGLCVGPPQHVSHPWRAKFGKVGKVWVSPMNPGLQGFQSIQQQQDVQEES